MVSSSDLLTVDWNSCVTACCCPICSVWAASCLSLILLASSATLSVFDSFCFFSFRHLRSSHDSYINTGINGIVPLWLSFLLQIYYNYMLISEYYPSHLLAPILHSLSVFHPLYVDTNVLILFMVIVFYMWFIIL